MEIQRLDPKAVWPPGSLTYEDAMAFLQRQVMATVARATDVSPEMLDTSETAYTYAGDGYCERHRIRQAAVDPARDVFEFKACDLARCEELRQKMARRMEERIAPAG